MSAAPAISVSDLKKTYRVSRTRGRGALGRLRALVAPATDRVPAVDSLSLTIEPGEQVAFIGPNGAGKSTTLKMLCGILNPDAGHARVLGRVPWSERAALSFDIGAVFGQRSQLWYHLPPRDTFALLAHVYEIDPHVHRRRLAALIDAFELDAFLDVPVKQLSLGQRMRAEIAASLLHAPKLLFLDEPTIGLDVAAKATIRGLLRDRALMHEATLLLTSHDTGDIEHVCHRAVVIHGGRLLWDGPIDDLRRRYMKTRRITLWSEAERLTFDLPGVRVTGARPHQTELELQVGETPIGALVDAAIRQGALHDLTIDDAPLDVVIRSLYAEAEEATP